MIDYESSNAIYEQNLPWYEKLHRDALKYGKSNVVKLADKPEEVYEELYCENLRENNVEEKKQC